MAVPEPAVTVRLTDVHVYYRVYEDPAAGLKQQFAQGGCGGGTARSRRCGA